MSIGFEHQPIGRYIVDIDGCLRATDQRYVDVRALRALHPQREVAVTTGYISAELRQQAPVAGVSELIYKPNTGDELLDAIERLASRVQRGRTGD